MTEAIPHYRRALEADPNFASAYDDLAWCYDALAEPGRAAECARKAFALQDRVSEYERLSISSIYYTLATGETDKAIETLEMMRTIYPRSAPVHNTLGGRYLATGQYAKAEPAFREAIRLTRHPNAYGGLAWTYVRQNRYEEAKQVIAEAHEQDIDNRTLRQLRYLIAFIEGDRPTMLQQVQWASRKLDEVFMLALQGNAAAFSGQMEDSRRYFRQAMDAARSHGLNSAAAEFAADLARWEACSGDCERARESISMALSGGSDLRLTQRAALVLALCGKTDEAQTLADQIEAKGTTRTFFRQISLPILRAAIALGRGNPSQALDALGSPPGNAAVSLWPRYLAGEAHRRTGAFSEARTDFQYVLNRRGLDPLSPVWALSRLGLARVDAASGDVAAGGRNYQELFALWNHADSDLPIFRQALSEYSSLNTKLRTTVGH